MSISEDPRYRHHIHPYSSSSSSSQHSQSSVMASRHHHVEGFNISVNTKRAFSFEELQSGAYFNSLDESDHQFYGMYGQPVLIPLPEDSGQEGWSLQGYTHMHSCGDSPSYSTTAVHYTPHSNPRVHQVSKSYTLVGSLGDLSPSTYIQAPSGAAQITRVSATARHSGKNGFKHESGFIQQSCGDLVYPSDFPSSPALHHPRQRYTHEGTTPAGLPNHLGRGSEDAKLLDDEPPMDHLPYPPPTQTPSSYEFQPYSPPEMTTSPSPYSPQSPALMVPSQSYMFEGESSTPAFIHTNQQHYHSQNESPSHTHGDSTESPSRRSPSPRGACRISPPPHQKRSMDKKPALACLFCRGRKIACGPPVLGNKDRTCNQCARRHLKCEYPLESRRGMRKRRSLVPRASGSPPPEINSSGPKVVKSGRKRSVDKRS